MVAKGLCRYHYNQDRRGVALTAFLGRLKLGDDGVAVMARITKAQAAGLDAAAARVGCSRYHLASRILEAWPEAWKA